VILNGDENQFDIVLDIFNKFGIVSYCNIRWKKSKAFYIAASKQWRQKPFEQLGLQWLNNSIHYLGIKIPTNLNGNKHELFCLNFEG